MKNKGHKISFVQPGSIAEELEIEVGDRLIAIDDTRVQDVFDYRFLVQNTYLEVLIEKANKEEWLLEIEKEYEEDLGIEFENGLMDEYRSCSNKCMFCFIDQMPKGMRDTLYFKDDDSRLSFLQGNYITLTNMKEQDINRIIHYHLAPINISVHTTNKKLRCEMLHNRFAGDVLNYLDKLYKAEIIMNGQIVLCKGINDGEELNKTIGDLSQYLPYMQSLSVVPVGLTKYRKNLYPLEPFEKEDAKKVLDTIHGWQQKLYQSYGSHFVHAGDEWYLLAEERIPKKEQYDGYLQLENGVGMIRLFQDEVEEALEKAEPDNRIHEISLATGVLAYPIIEKAVRKIEQKYSKIRVYVYSIQNNFFGERITVAGLITGKDLKEQLTGQILGKTLLLPEVMFKNKETVFLDNMTKEELETALQVPINIVKSSGQDFLDAILQNPNRNRDKIIQRGGRYEL